VERYSVGKPGTQPFSVATDAPMLHALHSRVR
jgi:hypothetical protein